MSIPQALDYLKRTEVHRHLTADEGLYQAASVGPDLIILDVMMPFHLEGIMV